MEKAKRKTTSKEKIAPIETTLVKKDHDISSDEKITTPRKSFFKLTNTTPILVVLLLIASFFLGMLTDKVSYLQNGNNVQVTPGNQQAQAPQPTTPPAKKFDGNTGDFPVLGNKNAKVTIVEFADFQCPFCEKWYTDVEQNLIKDYVNTGKVKFAFRQYPFLGQESTYAANAAECANEQGKFWDFHNYLYEHQGQENSGTFSIANLKTIAQTVGLDTNQFNQCLDANKYSQNVQKDLADGQAFGVNGTPASFINGQIVIGAQPYDSYKTLVDQELKK